MIRKFFNWIFVTRCGYYRLGDTRTDKTGKVWRLVKWAEDSKVSRFRIRE